MHRTTVLLLQSTVAQSRALAELFDVQRQLYNAALEERRGAWRWERRSVSRREQYDQLSGWADPMLRFGVTPARGSLLRLDRAFKGFYRRARVGQKPGYPRFKSAQRWDSVEYPQAASWRLSGTGRSGRLYLQGVGHISYRASKRGVIGTPKTLVVKREGRRYRAFVVGELAKSEPLAPTGAAVGIDLGVNSLIATSDAELVENQRLLRDNLDRLARAQRLVAGRKRGSIRRRKAGEQVGTIHRKIHRCRRDAAHQISRSLVDRYDLIVHEDLKIANMVRRPAPVPNDAGGFEPNGASAKAGLNREISAAGWGILLGMIHYKAEGAGRTVISVDPRHTSQTCHCCGRVDPGNRDGSAFRCTGCGYVDHADINAARNILRAGLALRLEREA